MKDVCISSSPISLYNIHLVLPLIQAFGFSRRTLTLLPATKSLYVFLFSPFRVSLPAHSTVIGLIALIIFVVEFKSQSVAICKFLQPPSDVSSLKPKYLPQHYFLGHSEPMFIPQFKESSFKTVQNNT
jgi:Na+/phosphate symporter